MYFLDTDICIYAVKGLYPKLRERILSCEPDLIEVPAMVKAELYWGANKSNTREKSIFTLKEFLRPFAVASFGEPEATAYGRLRFELESKGLPIGPNDYVIAATALARNAIVVTHNTREFSRVPGLQIEDWTQ